MPKRRRAVRCGAGDQRFTVLVINGDPYDSHAARSFESAMDVALPDRGARVDVFRTCARDAGEARMPSNYGTKGRKVRSFHYKRGG